MHRHAANLVAKLVPGGTATAIGLEGDLGAGKTTFVQGAAQFLGVETTATSPTFVIQKSYPLAGRQFDRLIHIDAYRLKGVEELSVLGWGETMRNPRNLVLIEWPERIRSALPEGTTILKLRFIDEKTRGISGNDIK